MKLELIDKINICDSLKEKVTDLALRDEVGILRLSESFYKGNLNCLALKDDITRLTVAIKAAECTKDYYAAKGIDEKILFNTLNDIAIWCENNGNKGLQNYMWIKNHICCELFRLGRLQFQLFKCSNPSLKYKKLPFGFNDNLIYIHIPQGKKLYINDCIESIKYAESFFNRYFPDYKYKYFFCESWLLCGNNIKFMDLNSNIVQFMTLFDIAYTVYDERQAFEKIFGITESFVKISFNRITGKRKSEALSYPEKTSLQRSAKNYLINGGKFGFGVGTIPKGLF